MTIVAVDRPGLARLAGELDTGAPVILPLPSPLPYVVVGADPGRVNAAKGRPPAQPVGVVLGSLAKIEPALALDADGIDLAAWLLYDERAGVLVPVSPAAPSWLAPATSDGMAFLGGAWLEQLDALRDGRGPLYMSSANRTSSRPAITVAEAEAIFAEEYFVADGEAFRDLTRPHASASMIAIAPDNTLTLARDGINNASFGSDGGAYLADLRRRWTACRPAPS